MYINHTFQSPSHVASTKSFESLTWCHNTVRKKKNQERKPMPDSPSCLVLRASSWLVLFVRSSSLFSLRMKWVIGVIWHNISATPPGGRTFLKCGFSWTDRWKVIKTPANSRPANSLMGEIQVALECEKYILMIRWYVHMMLPFESNLSKEEVLSLK